MMQSKMNPLALKEQYRKELLEFFDLITDHHFPNELKETFLLLLAEIIEPAVNQLEEKEKQREKIPSMLVEIELFKQNMKSEKVDITIIEPFLKKFLDIEHNCLGNIDDEFEFKGGIYAEDVRELLSSYQEQVFNGRLNDSIDLLVQQIELIANYSKSNAKIERHEYQLKKLNIQIVRLLKTIAPQVVAHSLEKERSFALNCSLLRLVCSEIKYSYKSHKKYVLNHLKDQSLLFNFITNKIIQGDLDFMMKVADRTVNINPEWFGEPYCPEEENLFIKQTLYEWIITQKINIKKVIAPLDTTALPKILKSDPKKIWINLYMGPSKNLPEGLEWLADLPLIDGNNQKPLYEIETNDDPKFNLLELMACGPDRISKSLLLSDKQIKNIKYYLDEPRRLENCSEAFREKLNDFVTTKTSEVFHFSSYKTEMLDKQIDEQFQLIRTQFQKLDNSKNKVVINILGHPCTFFESKESAQTSLRPLKSPFEPLDHFGNGFTLDFSVVAEIAKQIITRLQIEFKHNIDLSIRLNTCFAASWNYYSKNNFFDKQHTMLSICEFHTLGAKSVIFKKNNPTVELSNIEANNSFHKTIAGYFVNELKKSKHVNTRWKLKTFFDESVNNDEKAYGFLGKSPNDDEVNQVNDKNQIKISF